MDKIIAGKFLTNNNFSIGTRKLVHELFKNQGLVIIDADDKALKTLLKPVMVSDIFEQSSVDRLRVVASSDPARSRPRTGIGDVAQGDVRAHCP